MATNQKKAIQRSKIPNAGYQSPPMPKRLAPQLAPQPQAQMPPPQPTQQPMVPMSPAMVSSIKSSKKGQIPPGLAKYLAAKRAAKAGGNNG